MDERMRTIDLEQEVADWFAHRFKADKKRLLALIVEKFYETYEDDVDMANIRVQEIHDNILYPTTTDPRNANQQ